MIYLERLGYMKNLVIGLVGLSLVAVLSSCATYPKGDNFLVYEEEQSFPAAVLQDAVAANALNNESDVSAQAIPPELIGAIVEKTLEFIPKIISAKKEVALNTGTVKRRLVVNGYENGFSGLTNVISSGRFSIISK